MKERKNTETETGAVTVTVGVVVVEGGAAKGCKIIKMANIEKAKRAEKKTKIVKSNK